MNHLAWLVGVGAVAAVAFMSGVFVVAYRLKRFDLADVAWGLVFIVIAVVTLVVGSPDGRYTQRALNVTILVALWGLRLALHIFTRFRHKQTEDKRYAALREQYKASPVIGPWAKIFVVQGLLASVIMLPAVIVVASASNSWLWLDRIGCVVWLIGFAFEVIGDGQLSEFLANPANKGKLMTSGLWRFTRHPNYFGEVTQWWGIGLIALSVPYGWLGLIGPALITYLIVQVSGVPLLEKHYAGRSDWEEYKARTNKLIPGWPKR